MTKISLEVRQKERATELMNQFFEYDNKFRESIRRGETFLDCHHWQALAAEVIHEVDDEGLIHVAKDMYSWEKQTIDDYLECYKEIQSGAKI